MEKLLNLQLVPLRKGKPVQMPRGPCRRWVTFFFQNNVPIKDLFNVFRRCLLIIPISFFGLRPQNHLSDPDTYALLEGVKLCGHYI